MRRHVVSSVHAEKSPPKHLTDPSYKLYSISSFYLGGGGWVSENYRCGFTLESFTRLTNLDLMLPSRKQKKRNEGTENKPAPTWRLLRHVGKGRGSVLTFPSSDTTQQLLLSHLAHQMFDDPETWRKKKTSRIFWLLLKAFKPERIISKLKKSFLFRRDEPGPSGVIAPAATML